MPKTLFRYPFPPILKKDNSDKAVRKRFSSGEMGGVALLLLLFLAVPWVYIANEHVIQFWDQPSYHNLALYKMLSLREMDLSLGSIMRQLKEIYRSTGDSYSHFHTLVISPFLLLFGPSRSVYIILLSVLYQLPFTLGLGGIAALMVPDKKKEAFWMAIIIAVLTPALWLPTLNGYPDAGAAFLVAVAVLLYLQDMSLSSWWRIGVMASLLPVAILFRRHFVYDVITFFVVVSLHQVISVLGSPLGTLKEKGTRLFRQATRIGFIGLLLVVTLALIGWPFIERLIYTNYRYLYTSYERSTLINISYYLSLYGWIFVLTALGGLIWSVTSSTRAISRPIATFVLLFGIFSLLQWVFMVRQIGFHYSTHFTPWVILGLFAAGWQARQWLRGKKVAASFLVIGSGALFGINLLNALTWVEAGSKAADEAGWERVESIMLRPMAGKFAPTVRTDYDTLLRLTRYLHEIASPQDPIYVASSSFVLNDDLLWHTNRFLYEDVMKMKSKEFYESKTLNILHWIPFTDSGDPYPLEKLIESKFIITTTPVQLNLPEGEQQVLTVVVDAFHNNWLFAKDFTLLPKAFILEENTQVHIYKRIKPTSLQTAIATLNEMITYLDSRPGAQLDWINYNPSAAKGYVNLEKDGTHTLSIEAKKDNQPIWLFAENADVISKIKGIVASSKPLQGSMIVRANKVSKAGEILESVEKVVSASGISFELSFNTSLTDAFLVLQVALPEVDPDDAPNWIFVKNLTVSKPE